MERNEEQPVQKPLPGLENVDNSSTNVYKVHGIPHPEQNPQIKEKGEAEGDEEDTKPVKPVSEELLKFYGLKKVPAKAFHWSDRD